MIKQFYKDFQWLGAEGAVWIISDTHFHESDIIAGMNRISDETFIKIINSRIGKKDYLIHLGDVGDLSYMEQIKGIPARRILITGNHDTGSKNYEHLFGHIYTAPLIIGPKLLLSHEPIQSAEELGMVNLHGHVHNSVYYMDPYHYNFCADSIGFTPVNLNQWLTQGNLANVSSKHRQTIDYATIHSKRRKDNG